MRGASAFSATVIALLLSGCVLSPSDVASDGTVAFYVKDGPGDEFASLFVTFSRIEVHQASTTSPTETNASGANGTYPEDAGDGSDFTPTAGGWILLVNETHTVDLKLFQGDERSFLGATSLPAGDYAQIRIWLSDAFGIRTNGTRENITVSSSRLVIMEPWSVQAGKETQLTVDFDLNESLREAPDGRFLLRPVVTLLVDHRSGPSAEEVASSRNGT